MTTLIAEWSGQRWSLRRNGAGSAYRSRPTTAQEEISRLRQQLAAATGRAVRAEARATHLEQRLYRDALTGLWSRAWLEDSWPVSPEDQWPAGIAFVDLDRFKDINDTYGHAAGDVVLSVVGQRLTAQPRVDSVRLHGDELVVLVWHREDLGAIPAWIRGLVAAPIQLPHGDPTLTVTASVGLVPVQPGTALRDVLRAADTAMYAAKRSPRSTRIPRQQSGSAPDRRSVRSI